MERARTVKVFPTLNIQNGRVVPTVGARAHEVAPLDFLCRFLEQGFQRIALVDVDAAHGTGNNRELLAAMLQTCRRQAHPPCVQVAGGIRSSDQAQFFLDHGAQWLVVGTILHKSPLVVDQLLGRFQKHLTAAIDSRAGQPQKSGWSEQSTLDAPTLVGRILDAGFRRLLFVDIPHAGDTAPDFETARALVERTRLPVVMGGSIHTRDHVQQACTIHGLQGVLVDALLYVEQPELAPPSPTPSSCA